MSTSAGERTSGGGSSGSMRTSPSGVSTATEPTSCRHSGCQADQRRSPGATCSSLLMPAPLAEPDAVGGPVDEEHGADQVLPRDRPPLPRIARLGAIVSHEEVVAQGHLPTLSIMRGVCQAPLSLDVRFFELVEGLAAVRLDPDKALVVLLDRLPGQPDQPLDEGAAGAAFHEREPRRVEDDDLAAMRAGDIEADPAGEHAVAVAGLAAEGGPRAVQRRLHRRGGDPVRVDDVRLQGEDD